MWKTPSMTGPETPLLDRDERHFTLAVGAPLVLGAVAFALLDLEGAAAACLEAAGCDCEAPGPGIIAQAANAWSALALAAAGLAVVARSRRRSELSAGLTLAFAGAASFLYHSTLTEAAARLDGAGVAAAVAGLAALAWGSRLPLPITLFGVAAATAAGYRLEPPGFYGLVAGVAALALIGYLGAYGLRGSRTLAWAAAAAAAAAALWFLGRSDGAWCRPRGTFQPHAAWHLLIAAAGYLLVSHLRSVPSRIRRTPDPL